jgi:ABC-type uncharacterized transport system substrate-binding protein
MFLGQKMLKNIFRSFILYFSVILLSFMMIQPVASHPHVFIDTKIFIELNEEGIEGFWQHWAFDEYFSAWVIEEFDTDRDGKFNDDELKIVYERTLVGIKENGYFTRVLVGDTEIPVTGIEKFSVEIKENRTVYSFFVPLEIKIYQSTKDVFITVYDESFYCHVFFPPNELGFNGNRLNWAIEYATQELPQFSFYFGFLIPTAVKLSITPL